MARGTVAAFFHHAATSESTSAPLGSTAPRSSRSIGRAGRSVCTRLRATFMTISLANGRSEAWEQARTGHTSRLRINRYRRTARSVAELGLGELRSLDRAIPELAPHEASLEANNCDGEGESARKT
jgi:hypothetical protein